MITKQNVLKKLNGPLNFKNEWSATIINLYFFVLKKIYISQSNLKFITYFIYFSRLRPFIRQINKCPT